jgi:hypothetical protein
MIAAIKNRWRRWNNICGTPSLVALTVVTLLFAAAVIYLLETRGPWEKSLRKKIASGAELSFKQHITLLIGWGVFGFSCLAALMLAAARWWVRPTAPALSVGSPPQQASSQRKWFFALCLMILMAAAAWLRAPKLSHSLWNDEEMAFRKYVWGEYRPDAQNHLVRETVPWDRALFDNRKGNNHLWCTLESRLGLALANGHMPGALISPESGAEGFEEAAIRLFPFLSGLLAIAALGWLGWVLGHPRLGMFAAALLALSPWHLRYATEARGYSTMLLAVILAFGCLIRALQSGAWRWWAGFAAAQCVALLCYAGAAWLFLAMNACAAATILWSGRDRLANVLRLGVASLFSSAPLAVFLVPSLVQIRSYLQEESGKYPPINTAWLADLWNHLTTGLQGAKTLTQGSGGLSVEDITARTAWASLVIHWVLPLLALAGLAAMCLRDWRSRLVAVPTLAGFAIFLVQASATSGPFLPWHVQYVLPLFCLALVWPAIWFPRHITIFPVAVVVAFLMLNAPARDRLANIPRQRIREAAAAAAAPRAEHPGALTATFGTSDRQTRSYDPRAGVLESADDLKNLTVQATEKNLPLRVYYCDRQRADAEDAGILAQLDDMSQWREITRLPGMETKYSYRVLEFLPTVDSSDTTAPPTFSPTPPK